MPLVIIVLFVFGGLFLVLFDKNKTPPKDDTPHLRKTNARLERSLVNEYLLQGYSIEAAYDIVPVELSKRGFDLCMSPDSFVSDGLAYDEVKIEGHKAIKRDSTTIRRGGILLDQDSLAVKVQRQILEKEWKLRHPKEDIPCFSDDQIYKDFPELEFLFNRRTKYKSWLGKIFPVGSLVAISGKGDYKILEIDEFFSKYTLQDIYTKETIILRIADVNLMGIRKL